MTQTLSQLRNVAGPRDRAVLDAYEAALRAAFRPYRMGAFARPFGGGPRFNHLFLAGRNLSLCGHLVVARPKDELTRVDLAQVDCLACLEKFKTDQAGR